jgi:hypothetical protein
MSHRRRLPVRLSPRPLSAMLDRFGRAVETFIDFATIAAQGVVAGAVILVLSLTPPA